MTYMKIVYNLTGIDGDEQDLCVNSTECREITKSWYEHCYDCGIIQRVIEIEDEEE